MKERIKKLFMFQIYYALRQILFQIATSICLKPTEITINFGTVKIGKKLVTV
jgi:hypothetical protein